MLPGPALHKTRIMKVSMYYVLTFSGLSDLDVSMQLINMALSGFILHITQQIG